MVLTNIETLFPVAIRRALWPREKHDFDNHTSFLSAESFCQSVLTAIIIPLVNLATQTSFPQPTVI